jgi:hypothetical protein
VVRLPRRLAALVAACTAVLVGLAGALVPVSPPALEARPAGAAAWGIPVMGPATLSAAQLARWFRATGRSAAIPVSIEALAQYYIDEGAAENVRGDLAFAQSVVETGYFGFVGSMVKPANNNYAGMGACDSCNSGTQFPTAQIGIRAQIQHLRNYADLSSRAANLANPPVPQWYAPTTLDPVRAAYNFDHFFAKGRAPTWNQMGNGNWATAPNYASVVLSTYNRMLVFNGLPGACPPDGLWVGASQATQCPADLRSPGRAVAARAQGGYYTLSGTGAVKASGGAPALGSLSFSFDIARDIAVMPDGNGFIVLDGWGGLHKFGSAATGVMGTLQGPYWPGFDIARSLAITPDGQGLIVLDAYGGLHHAGTAPVITNGPYWYGWDIARSVAITPNGTGVYLLDGWGGVFSLGTAVYQGTTYWPGWDIAREIVTVPNGYVVLDGWGGLHTFGAAPARNNPTYFPADRFRQVAVSGGSYVVIRNDGVVSTL